MNKINFSLFYQCYLIDEASVLDLSSQTTYCMAELPSLEVPLLCE